MAVFAAKKLLMKTHAHLNKNAGLSEEADRLAERRSLALKDSEELKRRRDLILRVLKEQKQVERQQLLSTVNKTQPSIAFESGE